MLVIKAGIYKMLYRISNLNWVYAAYLGLLGRQVHVVLEILDHLLKVGVEG